MDTQRQHKPHNMVMEAVSKVEQQADMVTVAARPAASCRHPDSEQELEELEDEWASKED